MARVANIEVVFELEPLCKVVCLAVDCIYCLADSRGVLHCNLKHLELDERGRCESMALKEDGK